MRRMTPTGLKQYYWCILTTLSIIVMCFEVSFKLSGESCEGGKKISGGEEELVAME